MEPLVTPEQMRLVDAAASEPIEAIVDRVGAYLAIHAVDMMGGAYGRRVAVLAGPGSNGADGRAAARQLRRRGVRVVEISVADSPDEIAPCDLVIDAAFGTGLSRSYSPPGLPQGALVLAVDISSGLDGLTGERRGEPWSADRTVVLAGLKPGLFFEPARTLSGNTVLVDIGLDPLQTIDPQAYAITQSDIASWLRPPNPSQHKWQTACWIIAGSPGMTGAAWLAAAGAQRGGAGYVRVSLPGEHVESPVVEVVSTSIGPGLETPDVDRFGSLVIGPGLGRSPQTTTALIDLITRTAVPLVLDADALWHLEGVAAAVLKRRRGPVIITPHDGEFSLLDGASPAADRIASAQALANTLEVVVLLKGPTTVIASPASPAHVVSEGDDRLATAGTGDVLAGLIGALLAQGLEAQRAASAAAFVHGRAGRLGQSVGFIASDLPKLIPRALAELSASNTI